MISKTKIIVSFLKLIIFLIVFPTPATAQNTLEELFRKAKDTLPSNEYIIGQFKNCESKSNAALIKIHPIVHLNITPKCTGLNFAFHLTTIPVISYEPKFFGVLLNSYNKGFIPILLPSNDIDEFTYYTRIFELIDGKEIDDVILFVSPLYDSENTFIAYRNNDETRIRDFSGKEYLTIEDVILDKFGSFETYEDVFSNQPLRIQ